MKDSPDGIIGAKIVIMAKHERHVYDEMVETMEHLSVAKNDLKAESNKVEQG